MATTQQERAADPLDAIFYPKSIAVMGVTQTPGTVPYDIFHNILASGYTGVLYPIAPGKRSICAVSAHRYLTDVADEIDLAVIVFPAHVCDRAIAMCAEKGVKGVIIISAGFREVGPAGLEREKHVQAVCREHGIRLIGPNCLGVINTDPAVNLNASFARKMPDMGQIGFLSQSGALCTAVLDYARDKAIGFSKFVSFGNKAGVTEIDLLHYLHRDEQTKVILLYLEELRDGRALVAAAKEITRGPGAKPILAIKSGRTPQGASAAASHTGSLAGEDAVCDAVFAEAGIIRVGNIDELFNSAILLTYQPLSAGPRTAIVTNAGGPGVMATDSAVHCGLQIATFQPQTTEVLTKALPAAANKKNPVDVIGDARSDRYEAALGAVLADENVDEVLVILTPQSMTDIEAIAHGVVQAVDSCGKPVACSFMGATDVAAGVRILQAARIPHYILPEWACRAMADAQRFRLGLERPLETTEPPEVDRAAAERIVKSASPGYLPQDQALGLLAAYGLPVPVFEMCRTADQAAAFAGRINRAVTLQVVSEQVVHKTEAGGVRLDLRGADQVREAFEKMMLDVKKAVPDAKIAGAVCREMIAAGREVILGAKRDSSFGPVLMFGLGGVFVEVFRDVTFALAPVSAGRAERMIRATRGSALLSGFRGQPPADVPAVVDCLRRVGQLAADFTRIAELDVNPLIVSAEGHGAAVVDARIRLGE